MQFMTAFSMSLTMALSGLLLLGLTGPVETAPAFWPEEIRSTSWSRKTASLEAPIYFEENRGQAPSSTRFLGRAPHYQLRLRDDGLEVSASGGPWEQIRFSDANPDPLMEGKIPQAGETNYLLGRSQREWITEVKTFSEVWYRGIYPKTDLVFYGNTRQVEFDFRLAPGAVANAIVLAFDAGVAIGTQGALNIGDTEPPLRFKAPRAYQELPGLKREVPVAYVKRGPDQIGFRLGDYDPDYPLVIDPIIDYSSFAGGSRDDTVTAVAVDEEGSIYMTGFTDSGNFPTLPGAAQLISGGARDIIVTKVSSNGELVYSTYLGGGGNDTGRSVTVDSSGNVYLTGTTSSADFPVLSAFQLIPGGATDSFVTKLNPTGSALVFSSFLGGSSTEDGFSIALDGEANILVSGSTRSGNFPLVSAVQNFYGGGTADGFVTKISANGTALLFSTYFGGNREDVFREVLVDGDDRVLLVGFTRSGNFPTSAGAIQPALRGPVDFAAVKLDPTDSSVLFSTFWGGTNNEFGFAGALDGAGDLYLAGETSSGNFPVVNPLQSRLGGGVDAAVVRLRGDGSEVVYSTYLGGSRTDSAQAIVVDEKGKASVAGTTLSSNFPVKGTISRGGRGFEAFLARITPGGFDLLSSTLLGGSGSEFATGIAADASGAVLMVGSVDQTDFPVSEGFQNVFGAKGVYQTTNAGQAWVPRGLGVSDPDVRCLAADPSNSQHIYACSALGGVFKTTDGGGNWQPSGLGGLPVSDMVVDPSNGQRVFAATSLGLFRSEEGGANWEPLTDYLPVASPFQTLAIDRREPATVYAGSANQGMFKSSDSGNIWRAINNGLDGDAKQVFAIVVDPQNSRNVYIATQGAVYVSNNAGITWSVTNLNNVSTVSSLLIDPVNPNTLYAGTRSIAPAFDLVVKTTDRGLNWLGQPVGGVVSSLALDPNNRSVLYAGTLDAGVQKSSDAGLTFTGMNQGLGSLQVNDILVNSSNPSILLSATEGGSDGFLVRLEPNQVFFFPQIGNGTVDRLQFKTRFILLNTGAATTATVEFFAPSGSPLVLTLAGLGSGSRFEIPLAEGEAFSTETPGSGPLQIGYARIETSEDVGGTAVFIRNDTVSGRTLFESGVPSSTAMTDRFAVVVDFEGNRQTGLAIVNTSGGTTATQSESQLSLFDRDNLQIGMSSLNQAPGSQSARFIPNLFPEVRDLILNMKTGLLNVEGAGPFAAMTIRQSDDPNLEFPDEVATLTSFPVIGTNSLKGELFIPQVGDGVLRISLTEIDSTFTTAFFIVNTGNSNAAVTIDFFDSNSNPMELTLGGFGTSSTFNLQLGPRRSFVAQTPGQDELKIGYARIRSNSLQVGGSAVFTQTDFDTEVVLSEAGVPVATAQQDFSLFVDTMGDRDTGLAIVNALEPVNGSAGALETDAVIRLRLYDKQFNFLGENEIVLGAGEHLARFVPQFIPDVTQAAEMEGVLTVQSTNPIAVVTLLQTDVPGVGFPQEIPTLTAVPVIPGRADLQ